MGLGVPILKHFRVLKMLVQYDTVGELMVLTDQCDLYFMVQ